jgi:hypothetical protein
MRSPFHLTKVPGFTIFEITVVLAILSTIITIVAMAFNRFNEQLKNSSGINQELNEWFVFRANLWQELYLADSIVYREETIHLYRQAELVSYRIADELLERRKTGDWTSTGFEMEDLRETVGGNDKRIVFIFRWKGAPMTLEYYCKPDVKQQMDRYFDNLNHD